MSEFEQFQNEEVAVAPEQAPVAPVEAQPQGEYTRIIGLDVANSTLKIWTDELNLKYVNTIRQINDAGLVYSFKTDYQMYVYDKAVYEVGVVSAAGSGGRGISRYGSEKYRFESGKALCTMYTFLSGAQFVYQGQEIGMTNLSYDKWEDFQDVSTFSTKALLEKLKIFSDKKIMKMARYAARDNARTPVQWDNTENGGFTTGTPWFTVNPNYVDVNVASQENDPNSQLNYYRKAIALRKEYADAAIYGQFNLHLKGHKQLFVYDKIGENGTKLTVVINLSEKTLSSKKAKKYICPMAKEILSNYEGEIGDKLRPYEARVYKNALLGE